MYGTTGGTYSVRIFRPVMSGTELDWKKPGFNDSLWKSAVKLNSGRERDLDRGCLINEIQRHGAKWITSADNGQQNMYCRLNRFV